MPKRDSDLLLEDIESAIAKIERYLAGMDQERFLADEKTIDAVVRNLEVIGEAVRWLPDEFKNRHESVPWWQIAGLRNRIVHDYFGLDLEIIWRVVRDSIPELARQIRLLRK